MAWNCKKCNCNNANVRANCYYCEYHFGVISIRVNIIDAYDEIDMSNTKYELWKLEQTELGFETVETKAAKMNDFESNPNMSPKEKLYARFFASEITLVSDMDDASLHAHIEDLQTVAFEARARLAASDNVARERAAKKKSLKAVVKVDNDFTSNAIHNINERQKKLTKVEKEIERLVGLGIDRKDAENMYRASTQNAIKKGEIKAVVEDVSKRVGSIVDSIMESAMAPKVNEFKPVVNPFAAKVEEVKEYPEPTEESLKRGEDLNDIRLSEVLVEVAVEQEQRRIEQTIPPTKPVFVNPFASKE